MIVFAFQSLVSLRREGLWDHATLSFYALPAPVVLKLRS